MLKIKFPLKSVVVLCALVLQACATNPVSGGRQLAMSEEWELNAGKQYHQEILKQYKVYDNPKLQAYIEEIGEKLAANSHREDLVFHFTLLDSPQVNAFALPGGYVYITRGIMAYMTKESHLAGVIGHEIGHITARHGAQRAAQSQVAGVLGMAVAIGTGSRDLAQLSNVLGGAIISGYGRKQELESDRLGAEYIAKNNYNPKDMIDVVGILKSQELFERQRAQEEGRQPRAYHGLFATHPKNDLRLQEVIAAAEKYKDLSKPIPNNGRFLKLTNGMTFGESEAEGITRGNKFYHKPLDFFVEFPKGWRIQNQPSALIAISPNNQQQIVLRMEDLNRRVGPDQFLASKFQNFRAGERVQTSEDDAYAGVATVQNKRTGRQENLRVASIYRDKKSFLVYGSGKSQLPNAEFFDVVKSVRRLKSDERSLASERQITLVTARKGDTFAKYAQRSKALGKYGEETLRLINNMYPDGEPKAGQLVKLIQ
jgi:predicted Zn-dependent protease